MAKVDVNGIGIAYDIIGDKDKLMLDMAKLGFEFEREATVPGSGESIHVLELTKRKWVAAT